MTTSILIKTDSKLRDEAKALAEEFGMSLTAIVNAGLRQFVQERRIEMVSYPKPKASKLREWARESKYMDDHPEEVIVSHDIDELMKNLELK